MLRTHKGISVIMTLCLCIALLAPVFVVTPADAATVSASNAPVVAKAAGQNLGSVIIDFGILNAGTHSAVIKLPDSFVIADDGDGTAVENTRVSNLCGGLAPAFAASLGAPAAGQYRLIRLADNQLQFDLVAAAVSRDVKFGIVLTNVTVPSSADATINATVIKLDGDVTDGLVAVGKTSVGAVDILRTDPPTVSAGSPSIMVAPATSVFQIHVREDVAGAVVQGTDTLKFKLPKGVTWRTAAVALFPGNVPLPGTETITTDITDTSILKINRTTAGGVPATKYTFTINAQIDIDADNAAFGDIEAVISGRTTSNVGSVKLASYQDFGYTVKAEKPETEVVAGLRQQLMSNVTIKENIRNSLIAGRTITAKLNDGAKWTGNFNGTAKAGGFALAFTRSATDFTKATATVPALAGKGECALEKIEIDVAADYTGPIEIQFSGNAGINDKITVAKAIAPISGTAESKDVIIGVQKQAGGKITITEPKAETIKSRIFGGGAAADLVLSAPFGVTWAKAPTVKVVEGDLSLNTPTIGFPAAGRKHQVTIPVKSVSSKASKIEISDIIYDIDRTVPEGDLKIEIGGSALDQTSVLLNPNWVNRDVVATVVAAKVVTPAPKEGTQGAVAGQFKLGSNIYQVNGVSKIMDAAPYVKDSRTYVPIRYLGYALGLTDADIVYDQAAQKATLTLGDKKVELTVGSTTITVNGEAKTMDVAPEISNDRIMLPARYVAEGLGFQVGWDAGTGTVLVSK
ncbi:copper amine oxidase N-terminal domain-containing protein [Syntrophomonas palmitatica]|uniref:copper amine oxidase N-terminal domain-containing protein n=1 Tax=Syntrophomonas palmitatica TaxID=402877 RepID=UPI0006CF978B|nr:copper amine oxidase N-terminal domain-containing protein [Syntrophomonas palmitatica]